jgi:hypothetical protein
LTFNTDIKNIETIQNICGVNNSNIKILEELFDAKIEFSLNTVSTDLDGNEKIEKLKKVIDVLIFMSENSFYVTSRDIIYIFNNIFNVKFDY